MQRLTKARSKRIPRGLLWAAAFLLACSVGNGQEANPSCQQRALKPLLEVSRNQDLQESDRNEILGAIHQVGQMRCSEAIEDLVALLTFRSSYGEADNRAILRGPYTGNRYPATNALAEIGKAALPALVKVIETNDEGSLVSKNARFTVWAIIHDEKPVVDRFFKDAAAKARTPEAKKRLLKALETAESDFRSD